jgi:hypothetical protein
LDRSRAKQVVAAGIKDAFGELFAVNTRANELGGEEVKNKLRTMYAGKKTDLVIGNIAKTFKALCEYSDFSTPIPTPASDNGTTEAGASRAPVPTPPDTGLTVSEKQRSPSGRINVSGLQYHINIVLPDSRDQAVYDAIFRSLREHLG